MSDPRQPLAPTPVPSLTGRGDPDDPAIAALLGFEPVPRKRAVEGAWTPELQREFIARLAVTGSPGRACNEMGKDETGVMKLYRSPDGASFRAAWDAAVALAARRKAKRETQAAGVSPGTLPPSLDNRRKWRAPEAAPQPESEDEDEDSIARRTEEARDSITRKLLAARRLYLQEISGDPGKRAAFEILTQLPIDWDKAERLEPQDDEPWKRPSMRSPDMMLTAEAGWMGDMAHGPDKKTELRKAVDAHRAEQGLEPVEWGE